MVHVVWGQLVVHVEIKLYDSWNKLKPSELFHKQINNFVFCLQCNNQVAPSQEAKEEIELTDAKK